MKTINVVIDTNSLIQLLGRRSKFRRVWLAFLEGKFLWSFSNEILHEYEEILSQRLPRQAVEFYLQIMTNSYFTRKRDPYFSFRLIDADLDDNKFVDCAIATQASFIITKDKHFNELRNIPFPKVQVLTLEEFDSILFPDSND